MKDMTRNLLLSFPHLQYLANIVMATSAGVHCYGRIRIYRVQMLLQRRKVLAFWGGLDSKNLCNAEIINLI